VNGNGQYLTFFVHGEEYAVEVLRVREVIGALPLTRVPTTPPSIRGVVNLRGAVVPVVDLGLRFGLDQLVMTKRTCIVLVDVAEGGVTTGLGLLVDHVNQVLDLDEPDVMPVPAFGLHVRPELLRGIGSVGEKFVMLLDVDRILAALGARAVSELATPARALAHAVESPAQAGQS
jgi:purine-binding chemotaxis protein CheW